MTPRTVLCSIGAVTVPRRYFACASCRGKQVPWDRWAGMEHNRSLTRTARRMVTLAGTSWSFDRASAHLWEFCHLRVSDDTIERVCQEEGEKSKRWLEQSPAPIESLQRAAGVFEFSSDGVKINTTGGWREMRISVLARREPTLPCEPAQWDRRVLNEPTAKLAGCRIADANHVGASWRRLSARAGLRNTPHLSVIADGARWIWEQARKRLSPHAQWCVDVYHVSQHLHECGKSPHGDGPAARAWADQQLCCVLHHNGVGLIRQLRQQRHQTREVKHQRALDGLLSYLRDNQDSLWYRQRLQAGLPIGSGLIEGACKNMIGSRLKANSARWRIRRAERIGALRCLDYSGHWETYWQSKAA